MAEIKINEGFRFGGNFYPESKEGVEIPAAAEAFALKNGLAVDQATEAKAKAEAEANTNKGNAPANK